MRKDEEFAKEAFSRFLKARGVGGFTWNLGSQPPDWFLELDGVRYAVEVTQVMEFLTIGERRLTERGAVEALKRFLDNTEREALKMKILHGLYCVHMTPLPDFSAITEKLQERLFAFIESTANVERTEIVKIWRGRKGQHWFVQKVRSGGAGLAETMSIGGVKWEAEISSELRGLIAAAVERKLTAAQQLDFPVLLLVDAYHYADPKLWSSLLADMDAQPFHTIARVFSNFECQILRTNCQQWSGTA